MRLLYTCHSIEEGSHILAIVVASKHTTLKESSRAPVVCGKRCFPLFLDVTLTHGSCCGFDTPKNTSRLLTVPITYKFLPFHSFPGH